MRFFRDLSLSAAVAGFVAVLVGFTSSVAIVFQAAQAFGATPAQVTSWMWALGLGMGLCSLVPSLLLRMPVMVAWSTPGAAVLATAGLAGGFSMGEAVGAFMVSALLITVAGVTRWFERAMDRIPMEIAAALLAGVPVRCLTRFTADGREGDLNEYVVLQRDRPSARGETARSDAERSWVLPGSRGARPARASGGNGGVA